MRRVQQLSQHVVSKLSTTVGQVASTCSTARTHINHNHSTVSATTSSPAAPASSYSCPHTKTTKEATSKRTIMTTSAPSRASGPSGPPSTPGTKKLGDLTVTNQLLKHLSTDPDQGVVDPHRSRAVKKGHYVIAKGEPLKNPYLVCYSKSFARELDLEYVQFEKDENFMRTFSADSTTVPEKWQKMNFHPWATCYGVSVHGYWATNSPFGVFGYGDGRAMSIVEVEARAGTQERTWELQLKGSGRTAFSRNHDGRAVLRSSIREFLASEAFYHLGVPSTRALCLYASGDKPNSPQTTIQRAWYGDSSIKQNYQIMKTEPCAITCRASPSFLRVGQMELFARTRKNHELVQIVKFAILRDFPEINHLLPSGNDDEHGDQLSVDLIFKMIEIFAQRQAKLHTEWLRVGYIQGNMNNDNALLCGRTMDFGPFGMLEEYNRMQQIWEGDMEGKFAYKNQPLAGQVILMTLCQAMVAVFANDEKKQESLIEKMQKLLQGYPEMWKKNHYENCRKKLGLESWNDDCLKLYEALETVMEKDKLDFTHFFRALSNLALDENFGKNTAANADVIFKNAFYYKNFQSDAGSSTSTTGSSSTGSKLSPNCRKWLDDWTEMVKKVNKNNSEKPIVAEMKATSPAVIPRNWMMVLAYEAAEQGDMSVVRELHELFENPYTDSLPCKWNTRSPDWQFGKAGVRVMS
ncbi:unnamed protein product [Amoebophrya sp. A120]|nr:unnamed protein product [Amoebophrya sp. A120]|eukprot:GSA120T00006801001.1